MLRLSLQPIFDIPNKSRQPGAGVHGDQGETRMRWNHDLVATRSNRLSFRVRAKLRGRELPSKCDLSLALWVWKSESSDSFAAGEFHLDVERESRVLLGK